MTAFTTEQKLLRDSVKKLIEAGNIEKLTLYSAACDTETWNSPMRPSPRLRSLTWHAELEQVSFEGSPRHRLLP